MARKFIVWVSVRDSEMTITLPDGTTDTEADQACLEALETMIGNGDSGWTEIKSED